MSLRKRPLLAKIRAEADDENTMTLLWNAVIGGVKEA